MGATLDLIRLFINIFINNSIFEQIKFKVNEPHDRDIN